MASGFYEQVRDVVVMKGSGSLVQGSKSYEQLKVLDDMNDLVSHELSPLDFKN